MGSKRDRKSDKGKSAKSPEATPEDGSVDETEKNAPNPPRTTSKGWLTTPKFGSSTSGGGELEPGPERD